MSNDDSEQPRWGEREQEPAPGATSGSGWQQDEPPRYGERIVPTPSSASDPASDAPTQQYGFGQQQPGQQYGQPPAPAQEPWAQQQPAQQYGQPPASGQPQWVGAQQQNPWGQPQQAWQSEPPQRKKTLGVVAFAASVVALVLGVVGGVLLGNLLASVPGFSDLAQSGDTTGAQQEFTQRLLDDPSARGALVGVSLASGVGSLFGLWAIVQGIIAAVRRAGRAWGVTAIILAVVAPIVLVVIYISVAVSSVL